MKEKLNPNKEIAFVQDMNMLWGWNTASTTEYMNEPNVIDEIMQKRKVMWTQWKDFNRVPKKIVSE